MIVAEGHRPRIHEVARSVADALDREHRLITLRHVKRSASPTMRDRALGALLGHGAVQALLAGASGDMIGLRSLGVQHVPLSQACAKVPGLPNCGRWSTNSAADIRHAHLRGPM